MVAEQFEGLLETVEVIRADQNGDGSTVSGDNDPLVFTADSVNELRKPILHVPQ